MYKSVQSKFSIKALEDLIKRTQSVKFVGMVVKTAAGRKDLL